MTTSSPPEPDIRSLLESGFNEETARALYAQGEAVVVCPDATRRTRLDINGTHPSAPSASVAAPIKKNPAKGARKDPVPNECHWMLAPSSFTSFFIACLGSFLPFPRIFPQIGIYKESPFVV